MWKSGVRILYRPPNNRKNFKNMESKTQEAVLEQIEKLKKSMQGRSLARVFCCMISDENNYVFSMNVLERMLKRYLEKIDALIKEGGFSNEISAKFEKDVAEILHDAALKRNEYGWAIYFERTYGLYNDRSITTKDFWQLPEVNRKL